MSETSVQETSRRISGIRILHITCKIIAFLLITVLLLSVTGNVLIDDITYRIQAFYQEQKDSLDVVFVGSSNTHAFWSPLYAWRNYGIATSNYSASSQMLLSFRYMVEEVRKTQPHAVIVVTISSPDIITTREQFHHLTNVMPFSGTKLNLVRAYGKYEGITLSEQLEYLFPLIRYHSRWESLTAAKDLVLPKSPNLTDLYRKRIADISSLFHTSDERAPLPSETEEVLRDFLNYCEEEKFAVLFMRAPQANRSMKELAETNTLFDIIHERGFPVLDMQTCTDEVGLDLVHDFYNNNHTNIHGSLKYTDFVAAYLEEHFDLTSKKGDPSYKSFDDALEEYLPYTEPFLLPYETNGAARDFSLNAPAGLKAAKQKNGSVLLSWKGPTGSAADGYEIFRRSFSEESRWISIGRVGISESTFSDGSLNKEHTYSYTVVPYRMQDGITAYGNTDYNGISVAAGK